MIILTFGGVQVPPRYQDQHEPHRLFSRRADADVEVQREHGELLGSVIAGEIGIQ